VVMQGIFMESGTR